MPRVVFDCPVFVQAFLGSSGPAFACLRLAENAQVLLLVSHDTLAEVGDVLVRPALRRGRTTVTDTRVAAFMAHVMGCSYLVDPVPHVFAYGRDPKDEPYVDLAIGGRAAYLATRDKDLLDLMASASASSVDFRACWPSIEIVTPPELLRGVLV